MFYNKTSLPLYPETERKFMNLQLSQKELGLRIGNYRKMKGLTQGDLAKNIGMSRSSLAQIELGNRNIDVFELQKMAMVLGFSLDQFLSSDFNEVSEFTEKTEPAKEENNIRISVPQLNASKFKMYFYTCWNVAPASQISGKQF